MLYALFYELLYQEGTLTSPLRVFQYITFRAVGAALTSLILILVISPWFIRKFSACGITEVVKEEYLPQHKKKTSTPTMGGILIIGSIFFSSLLWLRLDIKWSWLLFLVTGFFFILGLIDDFLKLKRDKKQTTSNSTLTLGLSIKSKLFFQTLGGLCLGIYLILSPTNPHSGNYLFIPFTKGFYIDLGILYLPFVVFVIIAASNAVNLTDGLDGLAIGSLIFTTLTFIVFCYLCGHAKFAEYLKLVPVKGCGEVSIYLASLVGASLGFLWYNAYPAQIFMGNSGAFALGAIVGTAAVLSKQELILPICGFLFVMEAGTTLLQILGWRLQRRRCFLMTPLHHHFELCGWVEPKIVVRFWLISIISSLVALLSLKIR